MVNINNSDYYSKIPVGRDINKLPAHSANGTTVGYQYTGLTEEDRIVHEILQEHYDKVYKENMSHPDPVKYIQSKYYEYSSPNFCSYMSDDQRYTAYTHEMKMIETGGDTLGGFGRYDYALRNYKDLYTGDSATNGGIRNTDKEKQYARSVVNQQIINLLSGNGIELSDEMDLKFSIDPYYNQLKVSGNADKDTMSLIEKLMNEGDNARNLWEHAWICMHNSDNEIINSQANTVKSDQCSLWNELYYTTGYDIQNAIYKDGTFFAEDGTDLLALFRKKEPNNVLYEMYSERWIEYAKNGWNKNNDLVIEIGFDKNGLYDIGQEKGFGIMQDTWIKQTNQSIFDARA